MSKDDKKSDKAPIRRITHWWKTLPGPTRFTVRLGAWWAARKGLDHVWEKAKDVLENILDNGGPDLFA